MGNESHDFLPELGDQGGPQPGPSWANKAWPLTGADAESDWTQALDPTAMAVAVKAAAEKAGKATDPKAIEQAAADSIRAMLLIRLYRVRGHLAAELDPLGISNRELPEDLQLASHGFAVPPENSWKITRYGLAITFASTLSRPRWAMP